LRLEICEHFKFSYFIKITSKRLIKFNRILKKRL